MFKEDDKLSKNLNKGIELFLDRIDLTPRECEIFYDILNFTYKEGHIKGMEDYLNESK